MHDLYESLLKNPAPAPPTTACKLPSPPEPSPLPSPSSAPPQSPTKRNRPPKKEGGSKRVNPTDCEVHTKMETFPYSKIVARRTRSGKKEVKVKWVPCPQCHLTWRDSWVQL
ncbi:putative uncharacterized protein DDB_G0290521 isoform X2 [Paralichthys olivaceus]|uniref:putative uncharacterized protein DDB_G0290521 isoform X2 n=1 Tax=Paralichthys olivaceus TaxID=8255 RepID=UPI003752CD5D